MGRDRRHVYQANIHWTGNLGGGTTGYRDFARSYDIAAPGKPVLEGSADPAFRGDAGRYNPEDLLVASLSACHMLWYLHLCAVAGVVVEGYQDDAEGVMVEDDSGGGRFERVVLRPRATLKDPADQAKAVECHHEAHERCFIANSVSFPVDVEPQFVS